MRKPLALIPAALLLAGCGASEADEPQVIGPPPESMNQPVNIAPGHAPLIWMDGAAEGTIQFHAEPDEEMERYLQGVGADVTYTYADVDVDNRDGVESIGPNSLYLYTEAGDKYECDPVPYAATEHQDVGNDPEDMNDLLWEISYREDVAVGERRTVKMVCPAELPDEVASVTIEPNAGAEFEAHAE